MTAVVTALMCDHSKEAVVIAVEKTTKRQSFGEGDLGEILRRGSTECECRSRQVYCDNFGEL